MAKVFLLILKRLKTGTQRREFFTKEYFDAPLFFNTKLQEKDSYKTKDNFKKAQQKKEKLETEINKLSTEIDEIKTNAIYKNAFEWRFEFPEVLNNNGDF